MKYIKELIIDENQFDLLLKHPKLYIRFILSNKSNIEDKYKNFLIKNTKNIIDNQIISLLIPLTKNNKNLTKDEKNKIKKIILDSNMSFLIFDYADQVLNGPWEEAEKKLILDLDTAFNYVYNLKQSRWIELEKKLHLNPMNAAIYAYYILDKPWSESGLDIDIIERIENSIANDLKATIYYVENSVRVWPKGEKILATDPEAATNYAIKVKGRFQKAEKIIASDSKCAFDYAFSVLEKPWSEYFDIDQKIAELAEKNISESAKYSLKYAKRLFNGPWKPGEKAIFKDPEILYEYFSTIELNKDRWEEFEDILATDPITAVNSAKYLIQRRFIKAEEVIAGDGFAAYTYAVDVLKKRWIDIKDINKETSKMAENSILDSGYSVFYKLHFKIR